MTKLTVLFGSALILLGGVSFVLTGHQHYTSLIPAGFGIVLVVLGRMAEVPDSRRRMLFMHIAVTVGLLGFLFTASGLFHMVQLFRGVLLPHPAAIKEKAAMSALMLIFVLLCVRSFIAARRARA